MIDKEEYKCELIRMWDMQRGDEYKGKNICDGVFCEDCPLSEINNDGRDGCMEPMKVFEIIKIVDEWSKEHPQKQFKVSIAEFELLKIFKSYDNGVCHKFSTYKAMMKLLRNGCFAGATPDMTIDYYFKSCEVV